MQPKHLVRSRCFVKEETSDRVSHADANLMFELERADLLISTQSSDNMSCITNTNRFKVKLNEWPSEATSSASNFPNLAFLKQIASTSQCSCGAVVRWLARLPPGKNGWSPAVTDFLCGFWVLRLAPQKQLGLAPATLARLKAGEAAVEMNGRIRINVTKPLKTLKTLKRFPCASVSN